MPIINDMHWTYNAQEAGRFIFLEISNIRLQPPEIYWDFRALRAHFVVTMLLLNISVWSCSFFIIGQ